MRKLLRLPGELLVNSTIWALRSVLGRNPAAKLRRAIGVGSILLVALTDQRLRGTARPRE